MTDRRFFILAHQTARTRATQAVAEAPDGYTVRIAPPSRNGEQNARMHAMIGDIAKQWQFMGKRWHEEDMKRLLIDMFAETMRQLGTPLHHDGRVVPSIDGKRVVQLGIQSRDFYVKEAAEFIEWLTCFAVENNIDLHDHAEVAQ